MKKEVSTPVMLAVCAVVAIIVITAGWYFFNRQPQPSIARNPDGSVIMNPSTDNNGKFKPMGTGQGVEPGQIQSMPDESAKRPSSPDAAAQAL